MLPRPSRLLDRRLPLCHGQSFDPAPASHLAGLCFTRHQRGFKQLTRPAIPLALAARMERAALGLSPELRTPPTRSRRRTSGRGQAIEHGPGTTPLNSHQSILQSVVHSQRATSRRTTKSRRLVGPRSRPAQPCFCGNQISRRTSTEPSRCRKPWARSGVRFGLRLGGKARVSVQRNTCLKLRANLVPAGGLDDPSVAAQADARTRIQAQVTGAFAKASLSSTAPTGSTPFGHGPRSACAAASA